MANYRYVGGGAGVPGLPHEVSDVEAAALGVEDILKDAIENGSYVAVDPPAAKAASPQTKNTFGGKDVKKKESD